MNFIDMCVKVFHGYTHDQYLSITSIRLVRTNVSYHREMISYNCRKDVYL